MVPQIQAIRRAQRVDEQRQLEKIRAAMIGRDVETRAVLPDGLYSARDRLTLRAFHVHLEISARPPGEHAVQCAHRGLAPARRNARRSLVAARAIAAGSPITPDDLTWKRPAHGISPRNYDEVLTMRARRDIPEDTVLRWSDLDDGARG